MRRYAWCLDTSSLGYFLKKLALDQSSQARIFLDVAACFDGFSGGTSHRVYHVYPDLGSPGGSGSIVASDYQRFTTTELCDYTSLESSGPFTTDRYSAYFNTTAAQNYIDPDGYTQLGFRLGNDFLNSAPTWTSLARIYTLISLPNNNSNYTIGFLEVSYSLNQQINIGDVWKTIY